jgi:hypothetical protein
MLTHKPGKLNVLANTLSCLPDSKVHNSEDNWNMTVLKLEYFQAAATQTLCSSDDLEDSVCACTSCDPSVKTALSKMRSDGSRKLPDDTLEWEEVDGLIFYRGRLYIPNQMDLRRKILRHCHNTPAAGHPDQHQTMEEVHCHYWWPSMD